MEDMGVFVMGFFGIFVVVVGLEGVGLFQVILKGGLFLLGMQGDNSKRVGLPCSGIDLGGVRWLRLFPPETVVVLLFLCTAHPLSCTSTMTSSEGVWIRFLGGYDKRWRELLQGGILLLEVWSLT